MKKRLSDHMKRQLTIVMFFLTNIRASLRDSIICILHNDSNTSNLVGFKMNHHPFLMWKLLIWNILFSYHIPLWQRFSNLSFPKSIIYVSFSLHGILGIFFSFLASLENQSEDHCETLLNFLLREDPEIIRKIMLT